MHQHRSRHAASRIDVNLGIWLSCLLMCVIGLCIIAFDAGKEVRSASAALARICVHVICILRLFALPGFRPFADFFEVFLCTPP